MTSNIFYLVVMPVLISNNNPSHNSFDVNTKGLVSKEDQLKSRLKQDLRLIYVRQAGLIIICDWKGLLDGWKTSPFDWRMYDQLFI